MRSVQRNERALGQKSQYGILERRFKAADILGARNALHHQQAADLRHGQPCATGDLRQEERLRIGFVG